MKTDGYSPVHWAQSGKARAVCDDSIKFVGYDDRGDDGGTLSGSACYVTCPRCIRFNKGAWLEQVEQQLRKMKRDAADSAKRIAEIEGRLSIAREL